MDRSQHTTALLIKHYPLGEQNRGVVLLCPDYGLIRATVFGARSQKSRLGPLSSPFRHLEVWLYHQPAADNWKVSDWKELHDFSTVRDNVGRFYAASLWAELLILGHAGGDPEGAYRFLLEAYLLLSKWPVEGIRSLSLHYCVRWLSFLGSPFEKNEDNSSKNTPESDYSSDGGQVLSWLLHAGLSGLGTLETPFSIESAERVVFQRLHEIMGREILTLRDWKMIFPTGGKDESR